MQALAQSRLLELLAGLQQAQPTQQAGQKPGAALLQAMLGGKGKGARAGDAKYASLAALPPYAVNKFAETLGHQGSPVSGEAFQDDGYQDDGYQVF